MSPRRHPAAIAIAVFTLATGVSLGPHLLMLGYAVAGARPPAALLLLCPLHHLQAARPAFALHAPPLGTASS